MFTLLYVLARFRRPVRLLECPDRASLQRPGGMPGVTTEPPGRDRRRLRTSFRRVYLCTFWRLGFRQSSFRHITRAPQRLAPYAWARPLLSWHAIVPCTFRIQVKPSGPRTSLRVRPG